MENSIYIFELFVSFKQTNIVFFYGKEPACNRETWVGSLGWEDP